MKRISICLVEIWNVRWYKRITCLASLTRRRPTSQQLFTRFGGPINYTTIGSSHDSISAIGDSRSVKIFKVDLSMTAISVCNSDEKISTFSNICSLLIHTRIPYSVRVRRSPWNYAGKRYSSSVKGTWQPWRRDPVASLSTPAAKEPT